MKKKVRLLPSSGYLGAAAKWEVNRPKVVPSGPATPMEKVVFVRTQLILPRPWDRIQFAEAVLPGGEARGRECIQGDTRPTEQRSPRAKQPLPAGLRRFWLVASLLVGSQSAAALLPSSRLATSQNRQQQTVFYPTVWGVIQRQCTPAGRQTCLFPSRATCSCCDPGSASLVTAA